MDAILRDSADDSVDALYQNVERELRLVKTPQEIEAIRRFDRLDIDGQQAWLRGHEDLPRAFRAFLRGKHPWNPRSAPVVKVYAVRVWLGEPSEGLCRQAALLRQALAKSHEDGTYPEPPADSPAVPRGLLRSVSLALTPPTSWFEAFRREERHDAKEAWLNLAWCYDYGLGVTRDPEAAFYLYHAAASQGLTMAQHDLALCYALGLYVRDDAESAVRWEAKAAERGLPDAQAELGWLYSSGCGTRCSYAEADFWYQCAAGQGSSRAFCELGMDRAYRTRDYAEAIRYLEAAVSYDTWWSARAEYELSRMVTLGHGAERDYKVAFGHLHRAAELGYARAQYDLGEFYEHGIGTVQDTVEATRWYREAAKNGDGLAARKLRGLG